MRNFKDRAEAGARLAEDLLKKGFGGDSIVVALPRGGVEVGRVVADALGAPLRLVVPRKIGAPSQPEYAIGALTEDGTVIWNEAERAAADPDVLREIVGREQAEAKRRMSLYGQGLPSRDVKGRTVIVVDDGIATGLTMRAALTSLRREDPARLVAAVPVAPPSAVEDLRGSADETVILETPWALGAIGAFYDEFPQVDDERVIALLAEERL